MTKILFRNARIFDGVSNEFLERADVLTADGLIQEVSEIELPINGADVFDCGGRVLMPGMIDAHVHIYATSLNIQRVISAPMSYTAHHGARFLRHILSCGFTTVRDVGGGDFGIAMALKERVIEGPRLLYGGRVISQTGGHGDFRSAEEDPYLHCCGCPTAHVDFLTVIADGADQVRAAVREELRRGAVHIKIMASGGVASPSDPLDRCQYSDEEITAAVDEANRWGAYAVAHCHPAEAIERCARLGVRSIEHATLIDEASARLLAERKAFAVPTLSTIFALLDDGPVLGLPKASVDKLKLLGNRAVEGLAILKSAGVRIGFGTDLLGPHYVRQGTEFTLRSQTLSVVDILRSATSVNADLINHTDRLGCIKPGAFADILILSADPLQGIGVLAQPNGGGLDAIMKDGTFIKV